MKRWGLFLGLLVLAVVFALRKGLSVYERMRMLSRVRVEQVGESLKLTIVSKDLRGARWEVVAKRARMKGEVLELDGVRIVYRDGEKRVVVEGKKGKYFKRTKTGELEGDVVVNGSDWRLSGKKLVWREEKGEVCIPSPFVFKGRYLMEGEGLCYYPAGERIRVNRLKRVVIR